MNEMDEKGLMIGSIAILILALSISSCSGSKSESKEQARIRSESRSVREQEMASKRDYQIVKLFDHDGCTVYAYKAYGHWEEFFKCEQSK